MKKGLIFILGILTGIVLTFGIIFATSKNSRIPGLEFLNEPGEIFKGTELRVMDVVSLDSAISFTSRPATENPVLYIKRRNDKTPLYDDLVIKVPAGKCLRIVGTYNYETQMNEYVTIPVVMMFDK